MSANKTKVSKNIKKDKKKVLPYEWAEINDFFETLGEKGSAKDLWQMLKLALITDNDLTEPRDRSNMIFLYESTKKLFKNVFKLLINERALLVKINK